MDKMTLDDIVFENRNKAYGAHFLRKNYRNHLRTALVSGVSVFLLLSAGAWTYQKYHAEEEKEADKEVILIFPVEQKKAVQHEDKTTVEKKAETAARQKEIRVLPPEPGPDDLLTEEVLPTYEEIDQGIISQNNVDGVETTSVFVPPVQQVTVVKVAAPEEPEENIIFVNVQQKPEFPGGEAALYRFIGEHIRYPRAAQNSSVGGKVYVRFVIEKDGSVGNVELLKGIGFGCDEEAVRVVRLMPQWSPARQNGKPVRVYFSIPVFYRLE